MSQAENTLFQKKIYYGDKLNNIYSLVLGTSRNNSHQLISDKKRRFYQDILNAIDNFDEEPVILSLNNNNSNNNNQKKQQIRDAIHQLRIELNNSSTPQEDIQIIREIAEEIASYNPEPLTQNVPWTLLTPNNVASNYNNTNNNSIIEPGAPQKRERPNNNGNNRNNNRRTRRRLTYPDPPSLSNLSPVSTLANSQEGGKRHSKKTRKQRKQRKTQRKHR
jgi:hypothetical protein